MEKHQTQPLQTVLITGAAGNLGTKAIRLLETMPWCERIIGLYAPGTENAANQSKLVAVAADLTDAEGEWQQYMAGVTSVLHLAARNPVPECSWTDATLSFDMTVNIGLSALRNGVGRFVFCSSNHVMGRYKDEPLASTIGPGLLREDLPFGPGTRWSDGNHVIDGTGYASSKLMGERFITQLAAGSSGKLSSVSLRIGWALPGANDPSAINLTGSPNGVNGATESYDEDSARSLRWFRNMWLSNPDFERLVIAALTADSSTWPSPGIVVNGVSANRGTDWSLTNGADLIGYRPQDDVTASSRGP